MRFKRRYFIDSVDDRLLSACQRLRDVAVGQVDTTVELADVERISGTFFDIVMVRQVTAAGPASSRSRCLAEGTVWVLQQEIGHPPIRASQRKIRFVSRRNSAPYLIYHAIKQGMQP